MIFMGVWQREVLQEHCLNRQASAMSLPSTTSLLITPPTAGVRPAIAAATIMTGVAGIWGFAKRRLL